MIDYLKKCPALLSVMACSIILLTGCQQRSADDAGASSGGSSMGRSESGSAGTSGGTTSGGLGDSGSTSGGASSALEKAENSDTAITAKVKAALLRDSKVKGRDINVETYQGEVILSGFVDSPAQVDEAVKVARGVEGVTKVTNKMKPRQ